MLKHEDIWNAIDRLAYDRGLTASGLARRAGLDPTTFNKSKRITRDGKPRWPSTESIAKILGATGASLTEFLAFLSTEPAVDGRRMLPLISSSDATGTAAVDVLEPPEGRDKDEISFPDAVDNDAYAIEVTDSTLAPLYREGDILVVSPGAQVRRGDRVLVRTTDGQLFAAEVLRRTVRRTSLRPLSQDNEPMALEADKISWIVRVLWASQ
jgi:phage repressor protein C with HTH and peptisase S24 domain